MRILYSHRIQSRDGQAVHVEELIAAFREAGHEVKVVGPSFYEQASFGGGSRRIERLRRLLPGALGEMAELAYAGLATRRLARACDAFRPDFVYERYNLFHLAGAWLARRRGIPLLLEVNAPLAEERAAHGSLQLRRLAAGVEGWTWRSARQVLPVTAVLGQRVVARGVPPERITVIPNGIVPSRFAAPKRDAGGPAMRAPVLGFVGFVRAWHGLDAVLDAMARPTPPGGEPLDLVVAGDGPVVPDLRARAERLGLAGRTRFLGVVPPEQIPTLLAGVDIALQPMATDYASPLKIFDYMAAGCAIVAPDQPNIREILRHEETALLFDPAPSGMQAGVAPMWQAVQRLAGDAGLRARLGDAARARVFAAHSWAGNAARIIALAQTFTES